VDDTTGTVNYMPEVGSSSALSEGPTVFPNVKALDTIVTKFSYSYQMLEDGFDFSEFVNKLAGIRLARAVEYVLSLGASNGKPGTAMPNQPTGGILGQVTAGVTAGAVISSCTGPAALLGQLKGSVDMAYQATGTFMVNPVTYNFMETATGPRPQYRSDEVWT
jgi:HK97 family phage major capsid protein